NGVPRVLDFGLARDFSRDSEFVSEPTLGSEIQSAETSYPSDLTAFGDILGTPAYMAPEQHRGEIATTKSDQYSYCASLFEALYGVRRAVGNGYTPVDARHHLDPAMPHRVSVPPWLLEIVLKGLAEDPSRRHSSMNRLLDLLDEGRTQINRRNRAYLFFTIG